MRPALAFFEGWHRLIERTFNCLGKRYTVVGISNRLIQTTDLRCEPSCDRHASCIIPAALFMRIPDERRLNCRSSPRVVPIKFRRAFKDAVFVLIKRPIFHSLETTESQP